MPNNKQFIFHRETGALYAPDGTFLKKVYCPYSGKTNKLTINFDKKAEYGSCNYCDDRILNIDTLPADEVIAQLLSDPDSCVHASAQAGKVIFIGADPVDEEDEETVYEADQLVIRTARSLEEMNRAVKGGFWPDVRLVTFDTDRMPKPIAFVRSMLIQFWCNPSINFG